MGDLAEEIKFVKLALGSFEDYEDEKDRKNYLKSELLLIPDENLKKQLKGYIRSTEEELKRARDHLQEKELKLIGTKTANHVEDYTIETLASPAPILREVYIESANFNNGKAASDFSPTSSNSVRFRGAGLMSHVVHFDPTSTDEDDRPMKVYDLMKLLPVDELDETVSFQLGCHLTVYNDLSKVAETGSLSTSASGRDVTVQDKFFQGLEKIFHKQLQVSKKIGSSTTLGKYGCGDGPASELSTPDAYLFDSAGYARGICEVKHSTDAPHVPLRQGISEAINIAIMQLKNGVKWNEVMVFIIGSNGFLFQLGVVIVLYPSFPVFIPLTCCLDLTDTNMCRQACHAMRCIERWIDHHPIVRDDDQSTSSASSEPPAYVFSRAALSTSRYHMKELHSFFPIKSNLQASLHYNFQVMAKLHQCLKCRKFVVFPICVREFEDDTNESGIVFPKMNGYNIGYPEEEALRFSYFEQLKTAIECIHQAGVVHLDLYPSNIMWKCDKEGGILLKIIDWDSAHFIHDPALKTLRVLEQRDHLFSRFPMVQRNSNTAYDWVYYHLMEDQSNNQELLKRDKLSLDLEFKRVRDAILNDGCN